MDQGAGGRLELEHGRLFHFASERRLKKKERTLDKRFAFGTSQSSRIEAAAGQSSGNDVSNSSECETKTAGTR